jgi:uncharacterized Zn finger protein (UPF0148 family)
MNNDSIKQGAYYLLRGGTLLSEPCKKCGNLQIKFKGEILCMNCQAETNKENLPSITVDREVPIPDKNDVHDKEQDLVGVEKFGTKIDTNLVLDEIENRLVKSISELGMQITANDCSKEYRNALKGIKECLKILEIIKRLKGITG